MNKIFLIITVFLFNGCSIFVDGFEKDLIERHNIELIQPTTQTFCKKNTKFSLISENKNSQGNFTKFLNKDHSLKKLSFIEKAVLWSLLQINLRPEASSPSSKLQILLQVAGEEYYLNSYSDKQDEYSFLKALETLLKRYKAKRSLKQLAKILDIKFNYPIQVSKELETFLAMNKSQISANNKWRKAFFRGDETLKMGESLPKINYSQLIKNYNKTRKSNHYKTNNFLFSNSPFKNAKTACNFDMTLYSDSIFLISKNVNKANTFGFKSKEDIFLAVSSQDLNKKIQPSLQFTFKGQANSRAPGICSFQTKNSKTWIVSSDSRDPGQHIYHLLEYGLLDTQEPEKVDKLFRFSRHLFLKSPIRLVIESRRSTEEQMNELLKLNIPIYNSQKLGKMWGFQSGKSLSTFILDDRRIGSLTCK